MSCFMLYLGIDKKYADLKLHTIKMADDFERNVNEIDHGIIPKDPSFYVYNPSSIDKTFAPHGESSIYVLVPVPNLKSYDKWSNSIITNFYNLIIDKLEKELNLKDFKKSIVFKKIFTPNNFREKYNSFFGSTFGLKPTLMQSNYFRPHNRHSTIKNLYFAGASVHPGAGVPIVITSGQLSAQELERDFK